jgi:transmembrane sensor
VREAFQVSWTDARARAGRLAMHRARRPARRWRLALGGVAAAALAAAALAVGLRSPVLERAGGRVARTPAASPLAPASDGRRVALRDGSQVTLVGPGSGIALAEESPTRTTIDVTGGAARFDVTHRPARRFRVRAGAVSVWVLGTAFTVERLSDGARVSVERGAVSVEWPGGGTRLAAGASGLFPPGGARPDVPPAQTQPLEAAPAPVRAAPPARAAAGTAPSAPSAPWRRLAAAGRFGPAYRALAAAGPAAVRDEPNDLLLAADVARTSGHPAAAVDPLRRLLRAFPQDPRAAAAAFTLGRVLADELGRPAAAAGAFAEAAALARGGTLAEEAIAREADGWRRAGDEGRAREAARRYLDRHPAGRHAARLRAYVEGR